MFDLMFGNASKRKRVQAVLTNRMNRTCFEDLSGSDRGPVRSPFCQVVFLISRRGRNWDFDNAAPVISRDISPEGLALIHTASITDDEVLVALADKDGSLNVVHCAVQHCSSLGYGFWQIVAKKLNRRYIGFDLSDDYIAYGRERLAAVNPGDALAGAPEPTMSAPKTNRKSGTRGKRRAARAKQST